MGVCRGFSRHRSHLVTKGQGAPARLPACWAAEGVWRWPAGGLNRPCSDRDRLPAQACQVPNRHSCKECNVCQHLQDTQARIRCVSGSGYTPAGKPFPLREGSACASSARSSKRSLNCRGASCHAHGKDIDAGHVSLWPFLTKTSGGLHGAAVASLLEFAGSVDRSRFQPHSSIHQTRHRSTRMTVIAGGPPDSAAQRIGHRARGFDQRLTVASGRPRPPLTVCHTGRTGSTLHPTDQVGGRLASRRAALERGLALEKNPQDNRKTPGHEHQLDASFKNMVAVASLRQEEETRTWQ